MPAQIDGERITFSLKTWCGLFGVAIAPATLVTGAFLQWASEINEINRKQDIRIQQVENTQTMLIKEQLGRLTRDFDQISSQVQAIATAQLSRGNIVWNNEALVKELLEELKAIKKSDD